MKRMINWKETLRFLVGVNAIALILGHGMMINPHSRNSAWRDFKDRPKQYTDNQLNCGGFSVQWNRNKGKCGVCGDAYDAKNPQYVYPGKFAKDKFITKTYRRGETITVTIKITSNHQGFFTFRLGRLMRQPITQDQLNYVLMQPDGSSTWPLKTSTNGKFNIPLVLPKGLTCDHCVLQWWWTVGNNWGCDANGDCGVGKGKKQETFVNCADISITDKGQPVPTTRVPSTDIHLTQETSTRLPRPKPSTKLPRPRPTSQAPSGKCHATGAYKNRPNMDQWCALNCERGYCPANICKCN
ncbi:uncharacterized protein [Acropora muricata]|uniref:uncharacterized protein n=1 Tax=Acropora muricata TaxID=159855 RepID=UPI0034E5CDCF